MYMCVYIRYIYIHTHTED